ncbi:transcription repressor OFP8-like [Hibiscus syriacus]|uniref:transcription repressor OFP8-like n=1 Tax=Hibiscus syriacus TaxID=106335 RepID=UPI001921E7BF|nr:transcription repressor OFP8-like [Hibiscus syriacus]
MENRFKLRISRMFRSSFGSCRTRKISDVIEKPVFTPQTHNNALLFNPSPSLSPSPPPPKARPFPSICKPKRHESTQSAINRDCVMITQRETMPRRKVFARYPPFVVSGSALGFDGRKCPTGNNPLSPLNLFSDCKDFGFYEEKKSMARHRTKKKNKRVHLKSKNTSTSATFFSSSSQGSANNYYSNHSGWWWLSSEDETEALFSSRNLSSDSSESFTGRNHRRRSERRCDNARRRRAKNRSCDMGVLPLEGTNDADDNKSKVKDSFAVVKRSSDPYKDFRASMVEMIVERQMFGAEDLEQLLQCFLSLNSHHHHRIIIEVFTEIWETLFCNWA